MSKHHGACLGKKSRLSETEADICSEWPMTRTVLEISWSWPGTTLQLTKMHLYSCCGACRSQSSVGLEMPDIVRVDSPQHQSPGLSWQPLSFQSCGLNCLHQQLTCLHHKHDSPGLSCQMLRSVCLYKLQPQAGGMGWLWCQRGGS